MSTISYESLGVNPTEEFGKCPHCDEELSKIVWGWCGVYYDLICKNGHSWKYEFPKEGKAKGVVSRY